MGKESFGIISLFEVGPRVFGFSIIRSLNIIIIFKKEKKTTCDLCSFFSSASPKPIF